MKQNHFLLTPYYIAQEVPGLHDIRRDGWWVNEPGMLPAGSPQEQMVIFYRSLRDQVAMTIQAGNRPVSIAGDCCTSLAVLAGLQQVGINPCLIWLDAHGDFNTWETTPSGFLGGMPLAMMVGRGEQTIPAGLGMKPLPEEQVILSDARDLDPGELQNLADSRVCHVRAVDELYHMDLPDGSLWVHFDTDVLDPAEAPAMNYPTPGGPSSEVLMRVFRRLAETSQVVAVSLSAWNPEMDHTGQTRAVCLALLETLIR